MLPHSAQDRPREKLERAGPGALGDNELLAVLVGHGTALADVLGVANRLLAAAGGVHGLARLSTGELGRIGGVGPAIAGRIRAAVELGRRTLTPAPDRVDMRSWHSAGRFLVPQFGAYPVERFGVVLLDTGLRVLGTRLLSTGSLDETPAHPREVFREAVGGGAAAVVVFHNHPSGDPAPSLDDVDLTRRLVAAGEVLGVQVMDHLILTDARYCSVMYCRDGESWHV
jgi:DNA repair protein RadC